MKNNTIIQRSLKSVWHPCSQMKDFEKKSLIPIKSASGSWLIDFEGKNILILPAHGGSIYLAITIKL